MSEATARYDLVGRSTIRRKILELILAEPRSRRHLREIARQVGTSAGTASRELHKLVAAGVVDRSVEGRQVYFQVKATQGSRRTVAESPARYGGTAVLGARQPDPIGLAIVRILGLRLRQAYGERLRDVYLFGSRARGDQEPDSDVDVLIVLDRIEGYGRDLRRASDAVSDLSLASGLSISRVLASESSWRDLDRPFLRSIAPDAVAV
jgi:predicted nucleotidyltransferase